MSTRVFTLKLSFYSRSATEASLNDEKQILVFHRLFSQFNTILSQNHSNSPHIQPDRVYRCIVRSCTLHLGLSVILPPVSTQDLNKLQYSTAYFQILIRELPDWTEIIKTEQRRRRTRPVYSHTFIESINSLLVIPHGTSSGLLRRNYVQNKSCQLHSHCLLK